MATKETHQNFFERFANVQQELIANKSQFNSFGGYNYRSCEDILSAVKPLCKENNIIIVITDEMVNIGDRYYIKATSKALDIFNEYPPIEVTAYAREELTKKGMDASQITGSASSYARKYSLNGLLCIDDTKDADTMDNTTSTPVQHVEHKYAPQPAQESFEPVGDGQVTFTAGKYSGKTVSSVTDFGYLHWVIEKSNMKPEIKQAAQSVLDGAEVA